MSVSRGVPGMDEDLTIEPLDEAEPAEREEPQHVSGEEGVELSDRDLKKLKKALILFNPGLRNAIKETVINDLLPSDEIRILVDMILSGRPEPRIKEYLEEQLGREISAQPETGVSGRRVIHSRPEYTREGRDRQKRLLKLTRIFGLAALAAFLVTILSYQYIYKPVMAKRKINEGVELILRPGDYEAKPKDYASAEELARYVDENYRERYLYGYNNYGMSYLKRKEYARAYKKLNTAYKIDPQDIDTLLNLGNYYAKIPARFYSTVQADVEKNYYPEDSRKGAQDAPA